MVSSLTSTMVSQGVLFWWTGRYFSHPNQSKSQIVGWLHPHLHPLESRASPRFSSIEENSWLLSIQKKNQSSELWWGTPWVPLLTMENPMAPWPYPHDYGNPLWISVDFQKTWAAGQGAAVRMVFWRAGWGADDLALSMGSHEETIK